MPDKRAVSDFMMEYTGHPLVDIGLAAICAFNHRAKPSELTDADLSNIREWMQQNYTKNPLRSFLTVVFPNSGFTQPAYFRQPDKQALYADNVLGAYQADVLDDRDPFFGLPVANVAYDVKGELPPGRAYRQHIPLLNGEGVINFGPYGESGVSASGAAMLAIQALPLGCAKCQGRLLGVHSESADILLHFASTFLEDNRAKISLARTAGSSKLPEADHTPQTLLVATLLEAKQMRVDAGDTGQPFSATAYWLSNSGQGPKLDIFHLPLPITGFLRIMQRAVFRSEWEAIVSRGWQRPSTRQRKSMKPFVPHYNTVYEGLFDLPATAPRFIRRYFLRMPQPRGHDSEDPRTDYSTTKESHLVSWKITAVFLKEVMNMDPERIEQIRKLGDQMAEYIIEQNDKRLLRDTYRARRYWELRTALLRASMANLRRGVAPVIGFDSYLAVFEDAETLGRPDWQLARDLVLIRMIEQLYDRKWVQSNLDELPDSEDIDRDET